MGGIQAGSPPCTSRRASLTLILSDTILEYCEVLVVSLSSTMLENRSICCFDMLFGFGPRPLNVMLEL
jgi:hypothetical protein